MNEYAGVSQWTGGIPVELPVDAVRRYVQGEDLTLEHFDLLQNYFEGRIIKMLEEHWEQKFADNFQRNDDIVHEDVCKLCEKFNGLGVAIALIKGENK